MGCEKCIRLFGSALDGAEAGRGDRSRLAGSLLVRGQRNRSSVAASGATDVRISLGPMRPHCSHPAVRRRRGGTRTAVRPSLVTVT